MTCMNTVDERRIILVCLFCVQNYGAEPVKSGTAPDRLLFRDA